MVLATRSLNLIVVAASEAIAPKITSHLFMHQGFCVIETDGPDITGLLDLIRETKPDALVVEMDVVSAFRTEIFNTLEEMKPQGHRPHIVAVSDEQEAQLDFARRQVLTRATVPLDLATSTVITPVTQAVIDGYSYYAPVGPYTVELTALQMDVLRLMAMGFDTGEICAKTQRSIDTLYYLQGEIRRRLEARSNEQAIVKAWRKQMVAMLTYPEEKVG